MTVSGLGTQGVTQAAATGSVPVESASSICSSLSQSGCYGIQSSICSQFGSGTAAATVTQTTGFVQANVGALAAPRCTGAFYTAAAAAVAGAGIAGVMMR